MVSKWMLLYDILKVKNNCEEARVRGEGQKELRYATSDSTRRGARHGQREGTQDGEDTGLGGGTATRHD